MRTLSMLLLATALTGCGLDTFDLDFSAEATIPGDPAGEVLEGLPFGAEFEDIDLLSHDELRDAGVDAGDIDSARIDAMSLEVLEGTTFEDWLSEIAIYVEADGLERQLVAELRGIGDLPIGTNVIHLDVTGVELKPYVAQPLTVVTEVVGRPPLTDTQIRANITVRVDADVSGFLGL